MLKPYRTIQDVLASPWAQSSRRQNAWNGLTACCAQPSWRIISIMTCALRTPPWTRSSGVQGKS
ncbi:MAG: hypothetical protein ACLSHJ_04065 [Oscillospiraceae bacterium]